MRINGISPITSGITKIQSPSLDKALSGTSGTDGVQDGGSFASSLANALNDVQASQTEAANLSSLAATGDVTPAEFLTKSTEAQLTLQLAVAVRNRAVEAFNEIMRMPV